MFPPQELKSTEAQEFPQWNRRLAKAEYIIRALFSQAFSFAISSPSCLQQPESVNINSMLHNAFVEAVTGEVAFFFLRMRILVYGN